MNKKMEKKTAKYFAYKFTTAMILLAIAILLLCGAGIAVSIYRITLTGIHEFSDVLQSPLLIAICLLCIVIVVAMLIKSQYIIDDTYYTTQFGFIKSKYKIKDVTSLVLNTDTKKLTVYFGNEFTVLSLSPTWQDEFIAAIREVKPDIDFSFTLAEKKDDEKKD